jgi:2-polyprenyl-6-methoxyphenol hydroxylase-like FAD-dependent oxidoreductase
MTIAGSRVAIAGGSIAGCAAAIALRRAGCDVEVFERSSGALRDRGAGIITPIPLLDELTAAGYLPADYPTCRFSTRWWLLGDGKPSGRLLCEQAGQVASHNWGLLWRALRANLDDNDYHDGVSVTAFEAAGDGVEVVLDDGSHARFDALVGADGYRSVVRQAMPWGSEADYAGYVFWRGNYDEARVTDRAYLDRADAAGAWTTVGFEGGHCILYPIPDFDHGSNPGERRINWGVYTSPPPGLDFTDPTSVPPGEVTPELYACLDAVLSRYFPEDVEALIRLTPRQEVSIQPIYDELAVHYTDGRVLLIGDAGAVTRPHTGSGATKALQDALALEKLAREADGWPTLLKAYDAERLATANTLVRLGRRLGHAQVEQTPDWAAMTPAGFEDWMAQTLAGERLYYYDDDAGPASHSC